MIPEKLTISNFFSYYINNVDSERLAPEDQKKAGIAKIVCSIFSVGIIPAICWIVRKCRHKKPNELLPTEEAAHKQGLQILKKENDLPNEKPINAPEKTDHPQEFLKKPFLNFPPVLEVPEPLEPKVEVQVNQEPEKPQLIIKKEPIVQEPDISKVQEDNKLPLKKEIAEVNKVATPPQKAPFAPILFIPKGFNESLTQTEGLKSALADGLSLNKVEFREVPLEIDSEMSKNLQEFSTVIYPIIINDRFTESKEKLADIEKLKAVNPKLKIVILALMKDTSLALREDLPGAVIKTQTKQVFDISGVGGGKKALVDRDALVNNLRQIASE